MSTGYSKNDHEAHVAALKRDRHCCRVALPGCNGRANEVHHIFGRSLERLRYMPENLLSVCRSCHRFLESNPVLDKGICKKVMLPEDWDTLEKAARATLGPGMIIIDE